MAVAVGATGVAVGVSVEVAAEVGAGVGGGAGATVGVGVSSPSQAASKTIAAVNDATASWMMRRLPSPPTFFSCTARHQPPVAQPGCRLKSAALFRAGFYQVYTNGQEANSWPRDEL